MQHLTSSSRERCSAPLRLFGAHQGSSRALQCSCEHVRSSRGFLEIAAVFLLGCSELSERCRLFGAHEGTSRALQCSCEHVPSSRGFLEIAAVLLLGCSELTWDPACEAVWSSRAVLESAAVLLSRCSELTRVLRERRSAHVNTFGAHEQF